MSATNVKKHDTASPVLVERELYCTEGNRPTICPGYRFSQLPPIIREFSLCFLL